MKFRLDVIEGHGHNYIALAIQVPWPVSLPGEALVFWALSDFSLT